jgi:hypothetical protein
MPYAQLPEVQREKDRRVVRGQGSEVKTQHVPDYIARVRGIGFRVELMPLRKKAAGESVLSGNCHGQY